jgi:hypothetical protein
MNTKLKYWITGVIVTIIGLVLAKVVSPAYADQSVIQLVLFLTGVVVALAGLGIILAGLRKP